MDLKTEIKKILSPPHDLFKIIKQFEEWSNTNHKALLTEADLWLLQLYEIDANFFTSFLMSHIPKTHRHLITTICQRAEADNNQVLFSAYYAQNSRELINQEISDWIIQKLSVDEIIKRIRWRYGHPDKLHLSESSCIALYRYAPRIWEVDLLGEVFRAQHRISFEYNNDFRNFRKMVKNALGFEKSSHQALQQALLIRFGTIEEKRAEIRRIIETAPNWETTEREIHAVGLSLNEDDIAAIQKRFPIVESKERSSLLYFLAANSDIFARQYIEKELAKAKTEAQMEEIISELRQKIHIFKLADIWILKVYELAPSFCLTFVSGYNRDYIKMSGKTAAALLEKVQKRGHREMLNFVYSQLYNTESWNAALLDLLESNLPQQAITTGLEDLDCQPRYLYAGQTRAYLKDEVAAAIFRSSPTYLYSFILENLDPKLAYTLLLQAAEGTDHYFVIFRQVADGVMWLEAMQKLLERDIPAEEIVTELERYQLQRRTTNNAFRNVQMNANILKGFVAKYGEAVLPFFERYISWITEGRLKSLLALDIDRAELLRELNVIARREPEAFSRMAQIWAMPLYERGAGFFESFIIRYMGRGNEYTTRELLARAKTDKQLNLFRSLLRTVVQANEWEKEIAKQLDSNPSEAELKSFLEFYDVPSWDYVLSDNLAAKLYKTNPELGLSFILRHIARHQRWGNPLSHDRLLKAAESNPEHHLMLLKLLSYEKYWKSQMEDLLNSNLSGEAVLERLETLHPLEYWQVRNPGILKKIFEKHGAAVAPYMVANIYWVGADDKFMEALEKNAPSSLFWQAVFALMLNHGTNSWSYKRWKHEIDELVRDDATDAQLAASLEMLSPVQESRWRRYQISEATALSLYQKYPETSRGFIQRYYQPNDKLLLFDNALRHKDEEMLDYLSYCAMSIINSLIYRAFPSHPEYQRPNKKAQEQITKLGEQVIQRFEALYQRDPQAYARHVGLTLAWWRPFTIWNASGMEEHNPVYRYFATQHLSTWMESSEALREVLESPNIFVQLIGLKILNAQEHPNLSQRILENKRIFRQLLLGRARLSTKRLALRAIEAAIAANPASASELLPIMEEAADFYGRLALSEQMMISLTRIKYALEQGGIYAG